MPGEGERDESLAVRVLAEGGGVLRGDTDRTRALLRQGRVVDDEERIPPTDEPICLARERHFQRLGIPSPGRDEVVQAVVARQAQALGHGLDALALAGADQAGHVERAHRPARRVPEGLQERPQPLLQLGPPTRIRGHGRLRPDQSGRALRTAVGSTSPAKVVLAPIH
jgi:hypothetical protein